MGKSATNSKADTAVKLVLVFFISLLSFSVGTYVGKQVSDSDAHRAALEMDYDSHGEKAAKPEATADNSTAPISDEEIADLTEEFVNQEREVASEAHGEKNAHSDKASDHVKDADGYTRHSKSKGENNEAAHPIESSGHGSESTHESKPHDRHAESAPKPQPAAERVANDQAPTPDMQRKREPSSVLPSVATTAIGKYTVQVASYATETEAKTQAATLTAKGYSAFFVPAEIKGRVWYRVSIGLFSDQKSAVNYRTELLATKAVTSAIVQKIVQ